MTTTSPTLTPTPVYKSKGASRVGNHWSVFSAKLNREVQLYSDLEYDHWLTVEWDRDVLEFCEQPCFAKTLIDGVLRRSVPDMWVRYDNGREEYLEVKYEKDIRNPESRTQEQLRIQSNWAKDAGFLYRIITENEIRKNPIKLSNLRRMTHSLRAFDCNVLMTQTETMKHAFLCALKESNGESTLAELLKAQSTPITDELKLAIIFTCIRTGFFKAPIENEKISWNTKISFE